VANTWQELFETGDEAPAAAGAEDCEPERRGFFRRLRENMAKTRQAIGAELQTTIFQSLDDEAFERLEETLIYADVGAPPPAKTV
jgi:fused signal recognition particle receptor